MADTPQPIELWKQSGGVASEYVRLMIEHGHIRSREQEAGLSDNERLIAATNRERVEAEARELERGRGTHNLTVELHNSTTFTASCSCRLWALENFGVSHPVDLDGARKIAWARHEEHRREMNVRFEIGPGRCAEMRMHPAAAEVITGTVCLGRGRRTRCAFCRNWSVAQCDYPVGGDCPKCKGEGVRGGYNCHDCAGTGRRMCNRRLCGKCRAHKPPDEDYCPDHRARAGLKRRREPCEWAQSEVTAKCIHRGCEEVVGQYHRCLWFKKRRRGMCLPCGAAYLEASE